MKLFTSQLCDPSSVLVKIEEAGMTYIFELPREELCRMSPFFNRGFQGSFVEATTGIMHIEEVPAELFRAFARWVTTDELKTCILEDLLELYVFADMFDIPALRAAIIDKLTVECFRLDFEVPDPSLIIFMMENIPRFYPIHTLMAIAVARVLWHNSEPLEALPYGFGVRVQKTLDKPYGLCDTCYEQSEDGNIPDNCSHFCNQPTDFDPGRYQEDDATEYGFASRHESP